MESKTRDLIKEQLMKDTSSEYEDGDDFGSKKRAKKQKIVVEFEGDWFDFFQFSKMKKLERYDKIKEDLVFTIRLYFSTMPYEVDFDFGTDESREESLVILREKLLDARVKFV